MMKFDQLIYFLELAKHQHVGKTAKILHISPSAISHAIDNLEVELCQKLFVKEGKRIFITEAGNALVERATSIIENLKKVKEEIADRSLQISGSFKIGGTHGLASSILTPTVLSSLKKYPNVLVELYSLRSSDVLSKIAIGEIDFGICYNPHSHPKVEVETIYEGNLFVVAKRDHEIFRIPVEKRVKEIQKYPACSPKSFQGIENCESHPMLDKMKIKANVKLMYDNYDVAVSSISGGDFWGLIPDWVIHQNRNLKKVFPDQPPAKLEISAIWNKSKFLGTYLKELLSELKESEILSGKLKEEKVSRADKHVSS